MKKLRMHYCSKKQMSESFLTAAFLSVSGGLQDMYTYISRGHVFANAQTGNIVLLSQHIFAGSGQMLSISDAGTVFYVWCCGGNWKFVSIFRI